MCIASWRRVTVEWQLQLPECRQTKSRLYMYEFVLLLAFEASFTSRLVYKHATMVAPNDPTVALKRRNLTSVGSDEAVMSQLSPLSTSLQPPSTMPMTAPPTGTSETMVTATSCAASQLSNHDSVCGVDAEQKARACCDEEKATASKPRLRSDSSVFLTSSRSTLDTKPSIVSESSIGGGKSSSSGFGMYRPLTVTGLTNNCTTTGCHNAQSKGNIQLDLLPSLSLDTVDDISSTDQDFQGHPDTCYLGTYSSMDTDASHNLRLSSSSPKRRTYILNTQRFLLNDDTQDEENLTLTNRTSVAESCNSADQDEVEEAEEDEGGLDEMREFLDYVTCGNAGCSSESCNCDYCGGIAKSAAPQDSKGKSTNQSFVEESGTIGSMIDGLLGYFSCGACVDGTVGEELSIAEDHSIHHSGSGGRHNKKKRDNDNDLTNRPNDQLPKSPVSETPTIEALYRQSLKLISEGRYDKFILICRAAPCVLTFRASNHGLSTVAHVLCRTENIPADDLAFRILSIDTSSLAIPDREGNLPLHILASKWRGRESSSSSGSKLGLLKVLLDIFPGAAATQNDDGELPLHLLLDTMAYGAENMDENVATSAVYKLLEVNPQSVGVSEAVMQRCPLHIALTRGPDCSIDVTRAILDRHKEKKISIAKLDYDGNSPLHLALKHKAPYEAIKSIVQDQNNIFLDIYLQPDAKGDLPLHTCLRHPRSVDSRLALVLIEASPFTSTCPNGEGLMPIQLATSSNADNELIRALLEADLPIEVCRDAPPSLATTFDATRAIAERQHGNSWWHVAIDCQDQYIDLIDQIISSLGLAEIVALSKATGRDSTTTTRQAAPPQLAALFRRYLSFLDNYTLVGETNVGNGIITTMAFDHDCSNESETDLLPDASALVYRGGFSEMKGRQISAIDDADEGFEIALAPSNQRIRYDEKNAGMVCLRCYELKERYMDEMKVRQTLEDVHTTPSARFVEAILNSFEYPTSPSCLVFQQQRHTLAVLLEEPENSNGIAWLRECRDILSQIGRALRYLHRANLVHGNLHPICIGRFDDGWKLSHVGQALPVGASIGGSFRHYAPPEQVSKFPAGTAIQTIVARPSYDMFSFGQLMARILLDQSEVLPAFEVNRLAAKEKLARFGNSSLSTLSQEMAKSGVGGLAADCIVRLLEPSPSKRPSSMSRVLSHRYFFDDDYELLASTTSCSPNPEECETDAGAKEELQQLESCPSTVETDIIVSNLDALTLELKSLSFGPQYYFQEQNDEEEDHQSQAAASKAPSISQSVLTARMANTSKLSCPPQQPLLLPPPLPPSLLPVGAKAPRMMPTTARQCCNTSMCNRENQGPVEH